jgi:hypothetical protein
VALEGIMNQLYDVIYNNSDLPRPIQNALENKVVATNQTIQVLFDVRCLDTHVHDSHRNL